MVAGIEFGVGTVAGLRLSRTRVAAPQAL